MNDEIAKVPLTTFLFLIMKGPWHLPLSLGWSRVVKKYTLAGTDILPALAPSFLW